MRIKAICIILNICIIFLTNESYCYHLDFDTKCEQHITSRFLQSYNVTIITELQMRFCGITDIDENAFGNMISLKNLDLGNNNIERLPANVFSKFSSLEELRLKSNKLQNLDPNLFKNLYELTLLDLHNNNINKIDKNLFKNLKKLKTLDLYSNKISVIEPGTFDNNIQLQYVDFYDNHITEVKNDIFTNLINLDQLYITDNRVRNIESDAFPPNLTQLLLSYNKMQYLDHKIITNLKKLKYLTLFQNPWNCDIKLKNLIFAVKNINLVMHPMYSLPSCTTPDKLKNRKWDGSLKDADFSSISISIEPTDTLSKGDTATLSCSTSSDISNNSRRTKLEWVYEDNTSIVNTMVDNGRSIAFKYETEKNGVIWSDLTIKDVQESDARLYKCVLYLDDEVLDEKSNKLTVT